MFDTHFYVTFTQARLLFDQHVECGLPIDGNCKLNSLLNREWPASMVSLPAVNSDI